MTLLEARTLVASWVDDINLGYFTPPQVNVFLNNAQFELQKLMLQSAQNRYIKVVQTPLVTFQKDYVLPIDFLKVHRLELVTGGTYPNEDVSMVDPITINQSDSIADHTGQPVGYYLKSGLISLVPPPQDSSATLRLYYSYRVSKLVNDTDVFDVPDEYSEYIPVTAALDCVMKDSRDAVTFMAKKTSYEKLLKDDAQERQQDRPRSIVMNSGGFDTGWGGGIF